MVMVVIHLLKWDGSLGLQIIHYDDVIMTTLASQITSLAIVYSIDYSDADQRKHQSSASLAFVWGIHRGPVNSPHKWPVTRKMFPFDHAAKYSIDCINLLLGYATISLCFAVVLVWIFSPIPLAINVLLMNYLYGVIIIRFPQHQRSNFDEFKQMYRINPPDLVP